jgi:hypothetical protein
MSRIDAAVKNFPPECPCLITQPHADRVELAQTTGWQRMSEAAALPATPLRSADSAESNGEGTVADSGGVVRS